ncbi:MAG: hypothetical protein KF729_02590 [Sandaracinaceae bacterium]|nr:hypothetical protein [Sandaracinaceae bacterium]
MGNRDSDFDPLSPFANDRGVELELDTRALDAARAAAPPRGRPARTATAGTVTLYEPEVPVEQAIPARAIELAGHGPAPPFVLEAPYAIRAWLRDRALRARLPELRRVRDAAEADVASSALELGRALFAAREHPRARELGAPLRMASAAAKLTAEHDEALARAREAARRSTARVEASIAEATQSMRPLRARARELQAEVVVHQQRYEAAQTAVHEASGALEALERARPDDADGRIALEAQRTLRRVEAEEAVREIGARTPELSRVEAEALELERLCAKGAAEIAELGASLARTEERIEREAADGRAAFERALVGLADEGLRLRLEAELAPLAARRARAHHDAWVAHGRELEMHELALTLVHERARRRGWAQLALAVLALVALVAWRLA